MDYYQLGNSAIKVSEISLGTWGIGGKYFGKVDDQKSMRAIQTALDHGINLIDTAPVYGDGHAERVVGKAIKGKEDQVILATKVGVLRRNGEVVDDLSPASVRQQIEESLRRLNRETIDLYQIHRPDPKTPLEQTLEVLAELQREGKYRYLGVSNFPLNLLKQARELVEIVSVQSHYSLLKREIESNLVPYCQSENIGVIGYGTLAGGLLTGKFTSMPDFQTDDQRAAFYDFYRPAIWEKVQHLLSVMRNIADENNRSVVEVAINWSRQKSGITSALVGMKSPEQAKMNIAASHWRLSDEELEILNDESMKVLESL